MQSRSILVTKGDEIGQLGVSDECVLPGGDGRNVRAPGSRGFLKAGTFRSRGVRVSDSQVTREEQRVTGVKF